VFQSFTALKQQLLALQSLIQHEESFRTPYIPPELFNLFFLSLDLELIAFCATVANLRGSANRNLEGIDWPVAELAIEQRCSSHYGRYSESLRLLSDELERISDNLGLAPGTSHLRDLLSRKERRGRLVQALLTFTGLDDSSLLVSFKKIKHANKDLTGIQRQSSKDPPKQFFKTLEKHRQRVDGVANVLDSKSGFDGRSDRQYCAFLCLNECLNPTENEANSPSWTQASSLFFQNKKPTTGAEWDVQVARFEDPPEDDAAGSEKDSKQDKDPGKSIWSVLASPGRIQKRITEMISILKVETTDAPDRSGDLDAFLQSYTNPDNGSQGRRFQLSAPNAKCRFFLCFEPKTKSPNKSWSTPWPIRAGPSDQQRALSTEQKLQIAHKVAFGLFCIFSTPWLRDGWDIHDVHLTQEGHSDGSIYPLFARNSDASVPPATNIRSHNPSGSGVQFIHYLGRFLVELCYGSSWHDIRRALLAVEEPSTTAGSGDPVLTQLLEWADDPRIGEKDKPFHLEGSSYIMAVQKCFTFMGDFQEGTGGSPQSLAREDIAQWMYRHIFAPLQFALEDYHKRQTQIYGLHTDLKVPLDSAPLPEDERKLSLFIDEEIDPREIKSKYVFPAFTRSLV